MPLTNPNKVVTEERLSEFYGQILPYMGGMPDVLANKFSKGDLYSTDEKMIGVSDDGKPLYQKTYIITNIVFNSYTPFATDINENYKIVDFRTIGINTDGAVLPIPLYEDSNNFMTVNKRRDNLNGGFVYYVKGYANLSKMRCTVQYTKTTDSTISIGSDTDYSTIEKIVGVDTDGSWVWQKDVIINNPSKGANITLMENAHIKNASGILTLSTGHRKLLPYCEPSAARGAVFNEDSNTIYMYFWDSDSSKVYTKAQITLQYTKTS